MPRIFICKKKIIAGHLTYVQKLDDRIKIRVGKEPDEKQRKDTDMDDASQNFYKMLVRV